jgi:membrane-bound ClpP family serine protease
MTLMNYYNISGFNGCLTLIIMGMVFMFLLRVFTGFIMATLPFWLVLGILMVFRNLYQTYVASRKPNVTVEEAYSTSSEEAYEPEQIFDPNEISRDAEDVEFVEFNDNEKY